MESPPEYLLTGGNVAGLVVRVGATVRKPATRATPAVAALLGHLARAGFDGSPRSLGRDEAGRHILEFIPLCHHDLAPWNLVCGPDRRAFIDWDGAGPGSRLWDLAYAAHGFVPLAAGGDPAADGPRLRALADGYGLGEQQRRELPALIGAHTRAMFNLLRCSAATGVRPWARLYAEGHGRHWGPAADYIDRHHDQWLGALLS